MDETWTIAELADRATQVLAGQPTEANGRVRDLPNERLVRWYTTIGVVDPPLGRRGRVALYGRRHLLQLVAVKRRQAEGRPLAGIQAELAGATDGTLATIARLDDADADVARVPATAAAGPDPAAALAPAQGRAVSPAPLRDLVASSPPHRARRAAGAHPVGRAAGPTPARDRFWASPPAPAASLAAPAAPSAPAAVAAEGSPAGDDPSPRPSPGSASAPSAPAPPGPVPVAGLRLAPGVTLVLDTGAPSTPLAPTPAQLAEVEAAAQPLLEALRRNGLAPDPQPAPRRTT